MSTILHHLHPFSHSLFPPHLPLCPSSSTNPSSLLPFPSTPRQVKADSTLLFSLFMCSAIRFFSNSLLPHDFSSFRSFKILFCLSAKHSNDLHQQDRHSNNLRVVLAAGGTGGHIFPAVAIADELRILDSTIQILFVGTPNSMESASIPAAGYPFAPIPPVKLYRPLFSLRNLSLPLHLIHSTIRCFKILQDFDPHLVIGTGGYVSFPTCLAALFKRIKIVIQEQNSVPGIANYVLSFFSELVFVAYNSTVDCFQRKHKCVVSGNPVRLSLRRFVSKVVARNEFFPRSGGKREDSEGKAMVILVLGGSFGANAINIALLNLYSQLLMEHKNWYIIWQTGFEAHGEMESLVRNHPRLVLTQ